MRNLINIVENAQEVREAKEPEWTGVMRAEIPPQYKGKKVLGQGVTSLALDNGDGNVILLTRDKLKADWLDHSGIAKRVGEYKSDAHKIPTFARLPIMIYAMPKLFRLDPENRKMVRKVCTAFRQLHHRFMQHDSTRGFFMQHADLQRLVKHFGDQKGHLLYDLIQFVGSKNLDPDHFHFDFTPNNFMQREDGSVVVLDPLVTKEITRLMDGFRFPMSYDEEGNRLDGKPRRD